MNLTMAYVHLDLSTILYLWTDNVHLWYIMTLITHSNNNNNNNNHMTLSNLTMIMVEEMVEDMVTAITVIRVRITPHIQVRPLPLYLVAGVRMNVVIIIHNMV